MTRIKMRFVLMLAAFLIVTFPSSHAGAGGYDPDFKPLDAQILIDECVSKQQALLDTGVTANMREGMAKIVGCLQDVIVELTPVLFEPDVRTPEDTREMLDAISKAYQPFMWQLYNEFRGCPGYCGTLYHIFHLTSYANVLDDIIHQMVDQMNEAQLTR
ncbi:MAG: hypothetical protein HQ501_09510 [Rhodospirillales bacterium]|nr:hypothetical protein [Rhodospirillales bacterium]